MFVLCWLSEFVRLAELQLRDAVDELKPEAHRVEQASANEPAPTPGGIQGIRIAASSHALIEALKFIV